MDELIQANTDLLNSNEQMRKELEEKTDLVKSYQLHGCKTSDLTLSARERNSKQNEASSGIHAEMVIELNDRIDELNSENDKLRKVIRDNKQGEKDTKKEVQNLKYDNKRL